MGILTIAVHVPDFWYDIGTYYTSWIVHFYYTKRGENENKLIQKWNETLMLDKDRHCNIRLAQCLLITHWNKTFW